MKKANKQKKPKSRKKLRYSKRNPKNTEKKAKIPENLLNLDFLDAIKRTPEGLLTYDPDDKRFNGTHKYAVALQHYEWQGLLTLKIHSRSYSMDDGRGEGSSNRFRFINVLMENLRVKFGISPKEYDWVASEEFGVSGVGHLHVIFSFDTLKEKNRMRRLKIHDFSENGKFYRELRESMIFTSLKMGVNHKKVDFHWRPMWENWSLVWYFCKMEFNRDDKIFDWAKKLKKMGLIKAA